MTQRATDQHAAQIAPVLLTTAEAAHYLNMPPTWLGEAARQHRINCVRLGRHVRFRIVHLDEPITAGEQDVDPTPPGAARLMLTAPTPRRAGRSRL